MRPRRLQAERYGHPYERPVLPSGLPAAAIEALAVSYLRHALRGARRGRWTWGDVHGFNRAVDWRPWALRVLDHGATW